MTLNDVLRDMPRFHMDGGESIAKWRLDTDTLMFLDRHLQSGMKTLETGSGMSTVAFAIKSTFHTCIVPDAAQVARITNYCEQARISLEKVQFVIERSEFALPVLKGGDYDLALIDGRHGFPTPFLDWYYMTLLLRAGGIVVLDDLHIWTCDLLKNYLLSEPEDWRCVRETTRAAIFEKRREITHNSEWISQPFVRQRSAGRSRLARLGQSVNLLTRGKLDLASSLFFPRLTRRAGRKLRRLRTAVVPQRWR